MFCCSHVRASPRTELSLQLLKAQDTIVICPAVMSQKVTRTRTRTRTLTLSLTLTRRELAMSIAKSADDEKAQILEALGKMREVTPNPNPDPNPNPQP